MKEPIQEFQHSIRIHAYVASIIQNETRLLDLVAFDVRTSKVVAVSKTLIVIELRHMVLFWVKVKIS